MFLENEFFWRSPENFCEDLFFGEHLRLCPWPRAFLSLASRESVLVGLSLASDFFLSLALSFVSSTPILLPNIPQHIHNRY